jgi:hypothetical protein
MKSVFRDLPCPVLIVHEHGHEFTPHWVGRTREATAHWRGNSSRSREAAAARTID